jgi:hypothetical protein
MSDCGILQQIAAMAKSKYVSRYLMHHQETHSGQELSAYAKAFPSGIQFFPKDLCAAQPVYGIEKPLCAQIK